MALLQSELIYRTVRQSKATAGQHNLTLEMARDFSFPLAPEDEQRELCTRIREAWATAESQRASIINQIEALGQLDQSILAKAFRGELVPQDPADEPASVLLERIKSLAVGKASTAVRKRTPRKS